MIRKGHSKMSIVKQCEALNIHRSGVYFKPKGESALNLELMSLMDKHYMDHPFKGANRMHTWLTLDKGYEVSKNRIERLFYKVMGLQAIMPGRHTSRRNKAHKVYPYLLRNLEVTHPNHVWGIDITYIPMQKGFMYKVAIIDLYSRYVVGWSISNSMDAEWCAETLEKAIEEHGCPEIINTDQGSQFTSEVFTNAVLGRQIKLSMDGKGRALDNVFIERFWRSLKYEKIYLNPPNDGAELFLLCVEYMDFYNNRRRHSSIGNQMPVNMFYQKVEAA